MTLSGLNLNASVIQFHSRRALQASSCQVNDAENAFWVVVCARLRFLNCVPPRFLSSLRWGTAETFQAHSSTLKNGGRGGTSDMRLARDARNSSGLKQLPWRRRAATSASCMGYSHLSALT